MGFVKFDKDETHFVIEQNDAGCIILTMILDVSLLGREQSQSVVRCRMRHIRCPPRPPIQICVPKLHGHHLVPPLVCLTAI